MIVLAFPSTSIPQRAAAPAAPNANSASGASVPSPQSTRKFLFQPAPVLRLCDDARRTIILPLACRARRGQTNRFANFWVPSDRTYLHPSQQTLTFSPAQMPSHQRLTRCPRIRFFPGAESTCDLPPHPHRCAVISDETPTHLIRVSHNARLNLFPLPLSSTEPDPARSSPPNRLPCLQGDVLPVVWPRPAQRLPPGLAPPTQQDQSRCAGQAARPAPRGSQPEVPSAHSEPGPQQPHDTSGHRCRTSPCCRGPEARSPS